MAINVFDNSISNDNGNKINTSLFVQKLYLRTNYIEANIGFDLKIILELNIYLILLVIEKKLQKIMLIIYSTILV